MNHPKPKDSNELFLQLRMFSEKYHGLHELQRLHIQKWPESVNPNVDKSTAQVDFEKKTVTYLWEFKKKQKPLPKDYPHRLQELLRGIRFLLGADWRLEIQDLSTKEVIFNSEDASGTTEKPARPGRSKSQRMAHRSRK